MGITSIDAVTPEPTPGLSFLVNADHGVDSSVVVHRLCQPSLPSLRRTLSYMFGTCGGISIICDTELSTLIESGVSYGRNVRTNQAREADEEILHFSGSPSLWLNETKVRPTGQIWSRVPPAAPQS